MSSPVDAKLQFRVLYRQFLFCVVDLEALSAHALGDSNKLLGQFAALLIFTSILLSPLLGFSSADMSPYTRLALTLGTEHFLVATTMLAVGIFAVLSWDSIFPDRRDVLVLAPLPVRAWTMFGAKVAATATALGLVVLLLNCGTGLGWPLAFAAMATPQALPTLTFEPAELPMSATDVQSDLDRSLKPAQTRGWLLPGTGAGLAVGVVKNGVRRVFTYGVANPDSLFEIGSITKPLTGLMLARMVAQGRAELDEPVRELLPPGTVAKPSGREITLLDLATHHSGLPRMPDDSALINTNPCSTYSPGELYAYLARHGVEKPTDSSYTYSNLGFGLLGQALSVRAGMSYADLLREEVTGPLGLRDTVVFVSGDQKKRFLQGFDEMFKPVRACGPDVLVGDGGIRSTAGDMLTFLESNLRPEKIGSMARVLEESHKLRADLPEGAKIALAWAYLPDSGIYWHDGATGGFTSDAFFNLRRNYAAVVLVNMGPNPFASPYLIAQHIRQRLSGEPAISLDTTLVPAGSGFAGVTRWFAAYWFTMLAGAMFIYFGVLAAQGLTAQILPRRLFLRVSGLLQMAVFCLLVCVYFLEPGFDGIAPLVFPELRPWILWSPSYWFLGLFHELNGSMYSALAPLARRAWMGLAITGLAAAVAYATCYMRTLRRIVEEPDITSSPRGFRWLPRFGNQLETAIGQFSVRTLARSRLHRLVLAFYLGIAFALTILLLEPLRTGPQLAGAFSSDPWHETKSLLTATIMTTVLAVVGLRVVFALPLEPKANWIFRVIGVRRGAEIRTATRRVLLLLAVAPIWVVSALLCFGLWPWRQATAHLLVLALLGVILVDGVLYGFRKVPFTCSYLPGKSQVHMVFWGAIGLVWLMAQSVIIEQQALESPRVMAAALVLLGLAAAVVRWRGEVASEDDWEPRFEEVPTTAVLELGLFRDGAAIGAVGPTLPAEDRTFPGR
jgi:CubicO group peptidase (beta-lactamase class C family)